MKNRVLASCPSEPEKPRVANTPQFTMENALLYEKWVVSRHRCEPHTRAWILWIFHLPRHYNFQIARGALWHWNYIHTYPIHLYTFTLVYLCTYTPLCLTRPWRDASGQLPALAAAQEVCECFHQQPGWVTPWWTQDTWLAPLCAWPSWQQAPLMPPLQDRWHLWQAEALKSCHGSTRTKQEALYIT